VPSRKGILRTIAAAHHPRNQAVVTSLKRYFPSGDPPPAMLRRSNTWLRPAYAIIRILSPPPLAPGRGRPWGGMRDQSCRHDERAIQISDSDLVVFSDGLLNILHNSIFAIGIRILRYSVSLVRRSHCHAHAHAHVSAPLLFSLGYRSPVNNERAHQRSSQEPKSFYRLQRQTALAGEFA